MKICFFTEWHKTTGRGHLTRCVSLAEGFIEKGFDVTIYLDCESNFNESAIEKIIPLNWLSNKALFEEKVGNSQIIIIDSYLAPLGYYEKAVELCEVPVFFDDYFRLNYPEGIIINGSIGIEADFYNKLIFSNKVLAGFEYQLLRKAFQIKTKKEILLKVKNILITLGGVNYSGIINEVIHKVWSIESELIIHVVVSENQERLIDSDKIKYYSNIDANKMHNLMELCDFAITGAGQTIYELIATGTPFLAIKVAENQKYNVAGLKKFELAFVLEEIENNKIFISEIDKLFAFNKREELNLKYKTFIDGKSSLRIISKIFKTGLDSWFTIRIASVNDMIHVFELSNNIEVRNNSFNQKEILLDDHKIWFNKTINNPKVFFQIVEVAGVFAGQVRYTIEDNECVVGISISPKFRGISLGEKILIVSAQNFKKVFQNVKTVTAYIKKENIGSVKIFEKAGYLLLLENDEKNFNACKYTLSL